MEPKVLVALVLVALLAETPYLFIHPQLQPDEVRNLGQADALFSVGALPDRQFRVLSVFLLGLFDALGALGFWTWLVGILSVYAVYSFGKAYTKDPLHYTLMMVTSSAYLLTGRFLMEKVQLVFLVGFLLSSTLLLESVFFVLSLTIKEMAIFFVPMKFFLKKDVKHLVFPVACVCLSFILFPDMILKILVHLPTAGIGVQGADPVSIPRNIIALLLSLTPVSLWYLLKGFKDANKGIFLCGALGLPLLIWSGSVDPRFHLFTVFFFYVVVTNVSVKMKSRFSYWLPVIANILFFLLDAYNLTHGHVLSLSSVI